MDKNIYIDGMCYSLKFGTKSLMMLKEFLNNNSNRELRSIKFFLSIAHNNLSRRESDEILQKLIETKGEEYIDVLLSDILKISFNGEVDFNLPFEELYRKTVGEMGIAPQIFYEMTPYEIELAYKGYLDRKQLEANCMIIAIRKAKDNKAVLFDFLNEGYKESTIEERENTFETLGI